MSFNWFFYGKGRNKKKDGTIYFSESDFIFERILENNKRDYNKEVKVINLTSIWEFYKYIGYDYKKKKYAS